MAANQGPQSAEAPPARSATVCLGNNRDCPLPGGSELQGHQTGVFSPKKRIEREMKKRYFPPGAARSVASGHLLCSGGCPAPGGAEGPTGNLPLRPSLLGLPGQRQCGWDEGLWLRCQRYTPCPHSGKGPPFTSGKCPSPTPCGPSCLVPLACSPGYHPPLHLPAPIAQLEVQRAPAPGCGPSHSDLWPVSQATPGPCLPLTLRSRTQAQ